jgi:putative spermidine/putrescine transport system permease protein
MDREVEPNRAAVTGGLTAPDKKQVRRIVPVVRLLLAPPLLFLVVTLGGALAIFLRNSFYAPAGMGITGTELTAANYVRLFDIYYAEVMLRTVMISLAVVVISALLGYPLAYHLRRAGPTARIVLLVVIACNAMSLVVRALGWIGILNDNGPINQILKLASLIESPIHFIGGDAGIIVGLVHGFVPLFVLTLLPVLNAIDPSLEQASAGLGAGPWTTWRKVTLPLSMPGVIAASLLTFAMCMGAYTTPALLAGGRATTFPMLVQQQVSTIMNYPMGAVLALALLLLVLFVTWISIGVAQPYMRARA